MIAQWQAGPEMASAPSDEIDVWRADLGPTAPRGHRPAARRALRRILARYLGEDPERIELTSGEHGKPAVSGPRPPLLFNLSHSGNIALVAVTREREVGVDLELADEHRDFVRLAEVGLDAPAAAVVRAAPEAHRSAIFYAAWVRKEALAKCHGVGLGASLPPTPASVSDLDAASGYAAAIAVAGPAQMPLRRFVLS
jgi:4'-phosphopantetheinyl transferase